jgi:hypothetical protein
MKKQSSASAPGPAISTWRARSSRCFLSLTSRVLFCILAPFFQLERVLLPGARAPGIAHFAEGIIVRFRSIRSDGPGCDYKAHYISLTHGKRTSRRGTTACRLRGCQVFKAHVLSFAFRCGTKLWLRVTLPASQRVNVCFDRAWAAVCDSTAHEPQCELSQALMLFYSNLRSLRSFHIEL